PTEEETTDEVPTPTDLPTIDPAAEEDAIEIVGMDGSGTLAVDMTYAPASELESSYGGTVAEPEHGDEYLVLTAKVTVAEGTLNSNPAQFDAITPYGGAVSRSSESYSLKGSGSGGPRECSEGAEDNVHILLADQRRAARVQRGRGVHHQAPLRRPASWWQRPELHHVHRRLQVGRPCVTQAQRFNPPPNWPEPPHDGWIPPADFSPGPSWGPVPAGW